MVRNYRSRASLYLMDGEKPKEELSHLETQLKLLKSFFPSRSLLKSVFLYIWCMVRDPEERMATFGDIHEEAV
jgi:hypothetical protein